MDESCSIEDALKALPLRIYVPKAIKEGNTIKINLLINEELSDDLNAASFAHHFSKNYSVRITFRSTVENSKNIIFWKLRSTDKAKEQQQIFYKLNITKDSNSAVTDHCQSHIDHALSKDFTGEHFLVNIS